MQSELKQDNIWNLMNQHFGTTLERKDTGAQLDFDKTTNFWIKVCKSLLSLRGIMIGRHFHTNMKVHTATCKDNNNSKSRAATYTYVKFKINMK